MTPQTDTDGLVRSYALAGLIISFLGVSAIAYTDFQGAGYPDPLNEGQARGQEVWRENNCQVCHQIHGFGGFHGPDLTNRLTDGVIDAELTTTILNGRGRMPAFDLSDEDLDALCAWLRWMDASGRAVPAPLEAKAPLIPLQHFELLALESRQRGGPVPDAEAQAGLEIWNKMQCGTCHVPFATGLLREPDLSARALDRSLESLSKILDEGLGRMPATPLSMEEKRKLQAFLQWTASNREELSALNLDLIQHEPFRWGEVPWFEYR